MNGSNCWGNSPIKLAYRDAEAFLRELAPRVEQMYEETDQIAANSWLQDPGRWQLFIEWEQSEAIRKGKRWKPRPAEPPTKYDPSIPDRWQGIFPKKEIIEKVHSTTIDFYGPDFEEAA